MGAGTPVRPGEPSHVVPVLPGSTTPVLPVTPCNTVLAQGKRPPVASPAGGLPLELAVPIGAAKPVG
eukprot:5058777-Amphidinium_carterae.1